MIHKSLLALTIAGSFAGIAAAQDAYWINSNGEIWRNSRGECWRAYNWSEATALPECEGGNYAKAAPIPVSVEPAKPVEVPTPAAALETIAEAAPAPVVVVPTTPIEPRKPVMEKQTISLNAKTMFASGKGELADTSDLDKLVVDLKKVSDLKGVTIEGYTDPIGNVANNNKLSQLRADSVKAYLVRSGIDAGKITATGKGSDNPVVQMSECKGKKGKALSECLAPNRRIEVSIDGTITVTR